MRRDVAVPRVRRVVRPHLRLAVPHADVAPHLRRRGRRRLVAPPEGGRERAHIGDAPSATQGVEALAIAGTRGRTADPIVAVAAAPACLLVARDSGALVRYSLPHLGPEGTFQLRCRPATMHINCDTSRVAIIDANGLLTLFDLNAGVEVAVPASDPPARFERKDARQFCWASDNPSRSP